MPSTFSIPNGLVSMRKDYRAFPPGHLSHIAPSHLRGKKAVLVKVTAQEHRPIKKVTFSHKIVEYVPTHFGPPHQQAFAIITVGYG